MPRDLARGGSKPNVRGLPVTPRAQVLRRVPRRSRDKPGSYGARFHFFELGKHGVKHKAATNEKYGRRSQLQGGI